MSTRVLYTLAPIVTLALALAGCKNMEWGGDDDDHGVKEQSVTMDEVPVAVRTTLMKEAGDGKVQEIDKQMWRGKTVYEADVLMGNQQKWEIAVREDGQLLRKMLDEETDDEDDRDDDDDDDDKED